MAPLAGLDSVHQLGHTFSAVLGCTPCAPPATRTAMTSIQSRLVTEPTKRDSSVRARYFLPFLPAGLAGAAASGAAAATGLAAGFLAPPGACGVGGSTVRVSRVRIVPRVSRGAWVGSGIRLEAEPEPVDERKGLHMGISSSLQHITTTGPWLATLTHPHAAQRHCNAAAVQHRLWRQQSRLPARCDWCLSPCLQLQLPPHACTCARTHVWPLGTASSNRPIAAEPRVQACWIDRLNA